MHGTRRGLLCLPGMHRCIVPLTHAVPAATAAASAAWLRLPSLLSNACNSHLTTQAHPSFQVCCTACCCWHTLLLTNKLICRWWLWCCRCCCWPPAAHRISPCLDSCLSCKLVHESSNSSRQRHCALLTQRQQRAVDSNLQHRNMLHQKLRQSAACRRSAGQQDAGCIPSLHCAMMNEAKYAAGSA